MAVWYKWVEVGGGGGDGDDGLVMVVVVVYIVRLYCNYTLLMKTFLAKNVHKTFVATILVDAKMIKIED